MQECKIYDNFPILPEISIVIPSYNQAKYIEQTILSILDEGYPKIEIIVIDGGSTDESTEIIKKYEDKLAYWISEPDKGQAHAINKGFSKATGEVLGWINSDDYYVPGYLYSVGEAFAKDRTLDIVYGNSITLDERDGKIYKSYGKFILDKYLIFGAIVDSHTTFWRSNIHVPLDEKVNCAMDYELWLRLLKKRKKHHINMFGGVFRLQEESKSLGKADTFKRKWMEDDIYIREKHGIENPRFLLVKEYLLVNLLYRYFCIVQIWLRGGYLR